MRVAIPYTLPREEVRRRLRARTGEIFAGGMAEVTAVWQNEDRMDLTIAAMGQSLAGHVDIEEAELAFVVDLPPALSFFEPMIAGRIKEKGTKLLA